MTEGKRQGTHHTTLQLDNLLSRMFKQLLLLLIDPLQVLPFSVDSFPLPDQSKVLVFRLRFLQSKNKTELAHIAFG